MHISLERKLSMLLCQYYLSYYLINLNLAVSLEIPDCETGWFLIHISTQNIYERLPETSLYSYAIMYCYV